jgi:hypothetical protein
MCKMKNEKKKFVDFVEMITRLPIVQQSAKIRINKRKEKYCLFPNNLYCLTIDNKIQHFTLGNLK